MTSRCSLKDSFLNFVEHLSNIDSMCRYSCLPTSEAAFVMCIKGVEQLKNDEKEKLKCFEVETLDLTQNKVEGLY
jgi:hypothetical protein